MGQPFVHMAPAPVYQVGATLADLTAEAAKTTAALLAASDSAAGGNSGWQSASALVSCGNYWHLHLTALENDTSALASSVVKAARLYNAADQETADRLQNVLKAMASSG